MDIHAALDKAEDVLHHNDVAFNTLHFGDLHDLA